MPLKVTWKKGMRLSTEVFNAMDYSVDENVRLSSLVASGGRYGLFTTVRPFEISANIHNNIIEMVSLNCHGLTKSGKFVDIEFDSNFTNTFDPRVAIPDSIGTDAFILVVRLHGNDRREVSEMYCETTYTFELIGENNPIDNDSLPICRIVNQYGWRLDETDYVPPCLYISAHPKYIEALDKARSLYKKISDRCLDSHDCVAGMLLSTFWTTVSSELINIDKLRDSLTPDALFASLQKVISSFVIGCRVDEYVSLENADPFVEYVKKPYNVKGLYTDIESGLKLCAEIAVKMEAVCNMTEVREVPVEKPKPGPTPPPTPVTPKPIGRKRWEGIEI